MPQACFQHDAGWGESLEHWLIRFSRILPPPPTPPRKGEGLGRNESSRLKYALACQVLKAVTSISMSIRGSSSPATIMVQAGRTSLR